jgi:hypothetical protein
MGNIKGSTHLSVDAECFVFQGAGNVSGIIEASQALPVLAVVICSPEELQSHLLQCICDECTISLLRQSTIAQHSNNVEIQQRVSQEMSHLALQGMQEQKTKGVTARATVSRCKNMSLQ